MSERKMTSSRKHHLKSLMLSIAKDILEEEEREREQEKRRYMEEKCPAPIMPRSLQELQELCKEIHRKIDVIDEERYNLEMKVNKGNIEIEDLKIKVQDVMGKFKKPVLKKVRMSADAMLKALLGSKHTVNLDLRANLKQVKKEAKEEDKELRDVGDWRKNIEDKSGMDGRKKMFEAEIPNEMSKAYDPFFVSSFVFYMSRIRRLGYELAEALDYVDGALFSATFSDTPNDMRWHLDVAENLLNNLPRYFDHPEVIMRMAEITSQRKMLSERSLGSDVNQCFMVMFLEDLEEHHRAQIYIYIHAITPPRPPAHAPTADHHSRLQRDTQSSAPAANMASEKRLSARRKHTLKSCMLVVANTLLEAEAEKKAEEREKFLSEKCPPVELPFSRDELVELCKKLHEQIDISEEERYVTEFKLNMVLNEVQDLNIKIVDLRGKFKRPRLKKVRMSADAMLKALLGSKHTVNMDLRANLKQVKKEVKEEDKQLRDVGDWRKNVEDKSDRKKMFDS
ncbi:uncharacterized protein KZ484_008876 [Pholidichthys leucotaenia]